MCIIVFGITFLGFALEMSHGCATAPVPPATAERAKAPVISEFWGEVRETTDRDPDDPDRGAIYVFVDPETMLKRDAAETCGDAVPDTRLVEGNRLLVHIQRTRFDRAQDYAVICKEPPKIG
jgi:hypothetical protein